MRARSRARRGGGSTLEGDSVGGLIHRCCSSLQLQADISLEVELWWGALVLLTPTPSAARRTPSDRRAVALGARGRRRGSWRGACRQLLQEGFRRPHPRRVPAATPPCRRPSMWARRAASSAKAVCRWSDARLWPAHRGLRLPRRDGAPPRGWRGSAAASERRPRPPSRERVWLRLRLRAKLTATCQRRRRWLLRRGVPLQIVPREDHGGWRRDIARLDELSLPGEPVEPALEGLLHPAGAKTSRA